MPVARVLTCTHSFPKSDRPGSVWSRTKSLGWRHRTTTGALRRSGSLDSREWVVPYIVLSKVRVSVSAYLDGTTKILKVNSRLTL